MHLQYIIIVKYYFYLSLNIISFIHNKYLNKYFLFYIVRNNSIEK